MPGLWKHGSNNALETCDSWRHLFIWGVWKNEGICLKTFLQRGEAVSESEMLVLEGWAPKSVPGWVQVVLSAQSVCAAFGCVMIMLISGTCHPQCGGVPVLQYW